MKSIDLLLYIYWIIQFTENNLQTPIHVRETQQHILHLFALYLELNSEENASARKCWVRPIFRLDRRISQGASDNLIQEMEREDSEKYFSYLRMSKRNFDILLKKVEPFIKKQHAVRVPIPPRTRLQICLRYLASGDSMASISFAFRVSTNTVSKIVQETCTAIWLSLRRSAFPKPSTQMWYNHARQFGDKWNFKHCIGALDGKLVVIQAPPKSGSAYYSYKKQFGINLMAIADANYRFIAVDIGATGRRSDDGVFSESRIGQRLESGNLSIPLPEPLEENGPSLPYVFVGDEAFALSTNLMTPYPRASALTFRQKIFNYRLSRARRIVENAFGILGARWRIYRSPIVGSEKLVRKIVQATTCLHNWLITQNLDDDVNEDSENYSHLTPRERTLPVNALRDISNLEDGRRLKRRNDTINKRIRDEFAQFFEVAGAVPWQWEKVLRNQM